ncbi:MAG: D-alanyl-D-alanine carboxypeptidase [Lachnospiraceae bacterium]|nr:D-alanyl-D-alanine carboxypeptidase [Lachnospiraceae bacterium]
MKTPVYMGFANDTEAVSVQTDTKADEITRNVAIGGELSLSATAPAAGALHAYSAVLYDGKAGRVLYEKNGYEVLPMASTTKIMTLLVVLEHTKPEDIVTVSKNAAKQPDVQLNMNTGEQYYVGDLCYSLMLESHNDTAVALAEHVGGSVEGFAAMMNAKAKALGAYSANFITPNGLDAEGHGITAADLAKIAAYAVKQDEFRKITTTPSHSFTELTKGRSFTVNNKDAFLTMMEGAIGVKTGFTGKAGYCFVGALEREDRLLISVVLASGWPPHKTYKWNDTRLLMNYGLEAFKMIPLVEDINLLPELPTLPVSDGQKDNVFLCYASEELKKVSEITLLRTGEENISYCVELTKNSITAPIKAGVTVGELVITIDGNCIKKLPVQTAEAVVPVDYRFCLKQILDLFFSGETLSFLKIKSIRITNYNVAAASSIVPFAEITTSARAKAASMFSQKLSFPTTEINPFFSIMERGCSRT